MVFFPPRSFPPLPLIPDDVAICDFMLDEKHGRSTFSSSQHPYTCGLSGKSYSWLEVRDRVDYLSRALAQEFNWHPNRGTEWDKVAACFLVNTVGCRLVFCCSMTCVYTDTSMIYRLIIYRYTGPFIDWLL
jgi:hypothetical protein